MRRSKRQRRRFRGRYQTHVYVSADGSTQTFLSRRRRGPRSKRNRTWVNGVACYNQRQIEKQICRVVQRGRMPSLSKDLWASIPIF